MKIDVNDTMNCRHDKAYRLKSAINPTLDNESYTYDKVGNRLTSASTAGNWTYNNSDQLLSTPTDTYEYTTNGNTKKVTPSDTTQKPSEYIYDARDRLAEVKKDNTTIQSNRYDFQQRRIVKTTAGGETYFLYGKTGLLAEYQSNGDFIQGYGYYPNASYTTNPVYTLKQSGGNYQADFYHNDHLATPQKLTDSTGAVSWAMESNAFGETTIKTQTTTNNLRFPGQYADSDIGLSQNYYRDYAPHLGRYDGGINNLAYVLNSPINNIDIMGEATNADYFNCIMNPFDCNKAKKCSDKALKETKKQFGRQGHNDIADAFRHCYWNCCMAQKIGSKEAKKFGDAHEDYWGNPECEKQMDLENNKIGRNLGEQNPNGNCSDLCKKAKLVLLNKKQCGEDCYYYYTYYPYYYYEK